MRYILSFLIKLIYLYNGNVMYVIGIKILRLLILNKYVVLGLYMKIFIKCLLFVYWLLDLNLNKVNILRKCLIYYIRFIIY